MLARLITMSMNREKEPSVVEQWLAQHSRRCDLSLDSRKIQSGDVFFAVPGSQKHGLVYARQAIEHGASAIIYDPAEGGHALAAELAGDSMLSDFLMEQPHLRDQVGLLASSFYQHPSHQLAVIGITGTNGKTSCSHYIAQAITALNQQNTKSQCGYIGTLGWGFPGTSQPTTNTTPDAVELQRILAALKQQGAAAVAMEASSHGLAQNRLQGVKVAGAVFTNLGHDHLDYHQSVKQYLDAKLELFRSMESGFAVINMDDPVANHVLEALQEDIRIYGFSLQSSNHLSANQLTVDSIQYQRNNTIFEMCFRGQRSLACLPLVGEFNIANALATVGVLLGMGVEFEQAVSVLQFLSPVPGRMEMVSSAVDDINVYVDYAHTPDALERALKAIRLTEKSKIRLVFGCGGNRDQGKRQRMGKIASRLADHVIVTDDNPRYENGEQIIDQIVTGCSEVPVQVIRDRFNAIETAILLAEDEDVILIAGKGHEDSQEIRGQMIPCNDRLIAKSALGKRREDNHPSL